MWFKIPSVCLFNKYLEGIFCVRHICLSLSASNVAFSSIHTNTLAHWNHVVEMSTHFPLTGKKSTQQTDEKHVRTTQWTSRRRAHFYFYNFDNADCVDAVCRFYTDISVYNTTHDCNKACFSYVSSSYHPFDLLYSSHIYFAKWDRDFWNKWRSMLEVWCFCNRFVSQLN